MWVMSKEHLNAKEENIFKSSNHEQNVRSTIYVTRYTPHHSWRGLGKYEVDGTDKVETTKAVSMTTAEASNGIF